MATDATVIIIVVIIVSCTSTTTAIVSKSEARTPESNDMDKTLFCFWSDYEELTAADHA